MLKLLSGAAIVGLASGLDGSQFTVSQGLSTIPESEQYQEFTTAGGGTPGGTCQSDWSYKCDGCDAADKVDVTGCVSTTDFVTPASPEVLSSQWCHVTDGGSSGGFNFDSKADQWTYCMYQFVTQGGSPSVENGTPCRAKWNYNEGKDLTQVTVENHCVSFDEYAPNTEGIDLSNVNTTGKFWCFVGEGEGYNPNKCADDDNSPQGSCQEYHEKTYEWGFCVDSTETTEPTRSPTSSPSAAPSVSPTGSPSVSPTASPTLKPTDSPVEVTPKDNTKTPTTSPIAGTVPTESPTESPTDGPTASPTPLNEGPGRVNTTDTPTKSPTTSPTTSSTGASTSALSSVALVLVSFMIMK